MGFVQRMYCVLTISFAVLAFGEGSAVHAGEQFAEPGNALGVEIIRELVRRGFCTDAAKCHRLIEIYGGHGNRVNFSVYGINERNRDALNIVVELMVRRGIVITRGVPIKLWVYVISHDDYVKLGIFQSIDAVLILEINK